MKYPMNYCIKILSAFLLFAGVTIFQSCAQLGELSNVSKPTVSITGMNVTGLSLHAVEITADVEIENPNNIGIDLASYNYALDINELNFLSGNEDRETKIGAQQSSSVKIPLQLNYSELLQTIESLRNESESEFNFAAEFGFDLPIIGRVSVPVQHSGKIPVVKRPSISLNNFSVDKLSLNGADLSIELNVENPNSFQLQMTRLAYNLQINGLESISGLMTEEINLAEGSSKNIKLPVSISFLNAGMSAYRILNGDENLDYKLSGSTTIGSDLPYFELSSFDFDKTGSVDILR